MSELTEPIWAERREEGVLSRALAVPVRLDWEKAAYLGLIVVAAIWRFWDLGSRALHHDESLHAWTAWKLFDGQGYQHNPMMHGPFQFFGTAFTFFVTGGPSDYTARVWPAMFGVILVALPYLLRHRLGRAGALLTAALIAFSPTLLYFSRFARNDIYIAVFTLGLVIALWRYIDEGKPRYLYLAAFLLALAFATKENIFLNVAILLAFLNLWLAFEFWRQIRDEHRMDAFSSANLLIFLLPTAWALVALWPFIGGFRERLGLRQWHRAGDFLLILGTFSAPQFAAAVQIPLEAFFGVDDRDLSRVVWSHFRFGPYETFNVTREDVLGFVTVVSLISATAVIGLRWNSRVWLLAAAAFYIPYALLYTSFLTNIDGFGSGSWQSLNYWIEQHDVRRGDQPDYYYLILLSAYEFLPLIFAGPALLYYSLRGGPGSWLLTALATVSLLAFFGADSLADVSEISVAIAIPVAAVALFAAVKGDMFERFLIFWVGATIFGYSQTGEKMPWLSTHTTLPMIILGGYVLGRIFSQPPAGDIARRASAYRAPLAAAVFGLAAVAFGVFGPSGGAWIALRILFAFVALAGVLLLLQPFHRYRLATVLAAAVIGALLVFTLRDGVMASYQHGDVPREMLVYTQTSPDIPDVLERIQEASKTSGLGKDIPIVVDNADGFTWPWAWYLRDYTAVTYTNITEGYDPTPKPGEPYPIVLVNMRNDGVLQPFRDRYAPPSRYRHRWWFPEEYRGIGRDNLLEAVGDFFGSLGRSTTWQTWWRYFRDREPPAPLGSVDSVAYFPSEYAVGLVEALEPLPPPPPDEAGRFILGRAGIEPGAFTDPAGLAVDAAGNLYVADAGNHRIQKFDPEGRFLAQVGSFGDDQGQFNEVWGLAVDAQGNVYAADTWNYRVQKLNRDLEFVLAWGSAVDPQNPAPGLFFGPRDIAIDPDGNIWVTDTGDGRLEVFTPDGDLLQVYGSIGSGPGQFQEPVGIEIDADGNVYVADTANHRIQKFDKEFNFLAEFPIPGWQATDAASKPYLALLPDGGLLAVEPAEGKLFRLDATGNVVATIEKAVDDTPFGLPRGVAFDPRGYVYIAEAGTDQVRRFPLADIGP